MKKNDDYYKQVEQEIKQGKYQEGLRTRALAEAGGDENKARALYIKFRVESLKTEAAEAILNAKRQREQRRIEDLSKELAEVGPVAKKKRKKIIIYGVGIGFVVGTIVGILGTVGHLFSESNWI